MKVTDKVRYVLANYPDTRNDDKRLIIMVWWIYHREAFLLQNEKSFIDVSKFFDLPSSESITRSRRKIQEQGDFQSNKQIHEYRKRNQKQIGENINTNNWQQSLNKII